MDDPEPRHEVGDDDLDASLAAELLTLTLGPDSHVEGTPHDGTPVEEPSAVGYEEWEPGLGGPLFGTDHARAAAADDTDEAPVALTLPGGFFEDPGPEPPPVIDEVTLAPVGRGQEANDAEASERAGPVVEGSLFGHPEAGADSEDDTSPVPVVDLPEGTFGSDAGETGDDESIAELVAGPLPAFTDELVASTTETGAGASPKEPPCRPALGGKVRMQNLSYGALSRKPARAAAAGMAAATLMALALALQPGADAPRRVETGLPRPTLATVPRVTPSTPLALVPSGANQPAALPPDTPAPGDPDHAPTLGPTLGPGPPRTGAQPAQTGFSAATAPRQASAPSPAPRSAGPSGPASPAPAYQPAAAETPARAPAPEPEPEPTTRDRRSTTTAASTTTPTTQPPPPPTTTPPWTQPEPAPTTRPPSTTPPTTAAPAPPPTTEPPSPSTSIPSVTRPCFDGNPPRPVPC